MMRAYYDADGEFALPQLHRHRPRIDHEDLMRKLLLLVLMFSTLALGSGCVYRANISQGNLIEQDDLDQVELGMTRNQVRFLLGTPLIDDPFHADRWDYIYYIRIGRKDATFKRWVTIVFVDDIVTIIDKDQELNPDL
jgi:outer membrane protein assembly factor BamE